MFRISTDGIEVEATNLADVLSLYNRVRFNEDASAPEADGANLAKVTEERDQLEIFYNALNKDAALLHKNLSDAVEQIKLREATITELRAANADFEEIKKGFIANIENLQSKLAVSKDKTDTDVSLILDLNRQLSQMNAIIRKECEQRGYVVGSDLSTVFEHIRAAQKSSVVEGENSVGKLIARLSVKSSEAESWRAQVEPLRTQVSTLEFSNKALMAELKSLRNPVKPARKRTRKTSTHK